MLMRVLIAVLSLVPSAAAPGPIMLGDDELNGLVKQVIIVCGGRLPDRPKVRVLDDSAFWRALQKEMLAPNGFSAQKCNE